MIGAWSAWAVIVLSPLLAAERLQGPTELLFWDNAKARHPQSHVRKGETDDIV